MTVNITQIDERAKLTALKVEGDLAAADAVMLTWVLARLEGGESITMDFSEVTFIDSEGAAIIHSLEEKGADLLGVDFFIRSLIGPTRTAIDKSLKGARS